MSFTHLNVHSCYSLLSGAIPVERLPILAKNLGMESVALTDTNGTYGLIPFLKACKEQEIHPVAGAEVDDAAGHRAVILVRNQPGLSALNRLISDRHLQEGFSLGPSLSKLPCEGVFILTSSLETLEALGPQPHIFAELSLSEERGSIRSLVQQAKRLGYAMVASSRAHFESKIGWGTHRLLSAIRTRTTIGNIPIGASVPESCWFRDEASLRRLFAELPEVLDRTTELARACRLDLELGKIRPSRFPVEPGQDPFQLLVHEARKGLRRRIKPPDSSGWEKLHKELAVIRTTGMIDTFLICWELVRWARQNGIPSVGRGSAANSLVAYSLGITHVNPLKHNLFFERFLNPARSTPADLDIDFGTDEREEVFRHIFAAYGEDRACMVGALSHLHSRGALRETAKALGIPESEIGPVLKRIPHHVLLKDLKAAVAAWPDLQHLPLDQEPFSSLLQAAQGLDGFPRNVMTHPCGLVVAPGILTDICPLQRGAKGYVITQWDMYGVEAAGIIKIDVLGQKGLAVILDVRQGLNREEACRDPYPDPEPFLRDPATQDAMAQGQTIGCYYIESPVMIQMLKQGRCRDFETLTALSSIIRPGVSNYGGKKEYLRRLLGLDPVSYLDPLLEPILKDSLGCLIYQEQVVRIAAEVGGMSLADADLLRRAMEWKKRGPTDLGEAKAKFLNQAGERGVREAEEIWRRLESFAGYAFCKAHSASFALESFESLYFKVHHPARFMAAVLSNQGGFYDASEYVEECRRLGLAVLLPHVNHSTWEYRQETPSSIRVGLMAVHGLSREAADKVIEGFRRDGPYIHLDSLRKRVPTLDQPELENLIRCGALDGLGQNRAELLWGLSLKSSPDPSTSISNWTPALQARAECDILGFSPQGHPLTLYREAIQAALRKRKIAHLVPASRLPEYAGRNVWSVGWWVTAKRTFTQTSGQPMMFSTFSDKTGRFETVLFPDAFRRNARILSARSRRPYLLCGRVEDEFGVCQINAQEFHLAQATCY